MKKKTLTVATVILAATMMTSSCIGKFALFNNLLSWNQKATGNKFVNELLFIILTPAYAVCSVADVLVLNTVEFWSGSNPIGKAGKIEKVWGQDGRQYAVKTLKNGYEITDPKGEKVCFIFNEKDQTWSMEENGICKEVIKFNEDGTIRATLPTGEQINVTADEAGLCNARMAMNGGCYFATIK